MFPRHVSPSRPASTAAAHWSGPSAAPVVAPADQLFRLLEYGLAFCGLLLCSRALWPLYTSSWGNQGQALGDANAGFLVLGVAIFGSAAIQLCVRAGEFWALAGLNGLLFLLPLLALLSCLWAVDPEVTLRRAAALCLTTMFGAWLALRFRPLSLLRLVCAALLCASLLSLLTALAWPQIGRHTGDSHAGLWRGTFGHKNIMGRILSLAFILACAAILIGRGCRPLGLVLLAPAGLLILLSGSITAVAVALPLAVGVLLLHRLAARRVPPGPLLCLGFAALVLGILLTSFLFLPLLDLLGRDPTLSGRTRLWQHALEVGLDRPWLGAGYRSFWLEDGPGARVMTQVSWGQGNIGNGHNAYLDFALELGLSGVLAWLFWLAALCRRVALLLSARDPLGLIMVACLGHLALYACTERVLLEHSDLGWLLLVTVALQASPNLALARQRARS